MATACVTAVLATVVCIHVSSQEGVGRHALVVGIGDYSGGSGWSKINGDRDAGLVVQMLERNGFLEEDIEVLLNARATKSNIRDAFAALCRQVGSGDIVYVHFSGHGQQVTDVNGDEEDGLDESFVPYDACKEHTTAIPRAWSSASHAGLFISDVSYILFISMQSSNENAPAEKICRT